MPDRPYRLGRREVRGQVLGWRPGQALSLGLGVLGFVEGMDLGHALAAVGVLALLCGVLGAVLPVGGRGVDEWVPVVAAHLVRVRGGALASGAAVVEPDGEPAHLAWPDGRRTVVVELRHRGLNPLADEPRAVPEALAAWLRGLSRPGPRPVVTLLTTCGPARPARSAPWNDPGRVVATHVAVTSTSLPDLAAELRRHGVGGVVALGADGLEALLAARVAPAEGTLLHCDVASRWSSLAAPRSLHAAFVVEEWPAGELDEGAIAALCVAADRRTVAVHLGVDELVHARERAARVRTGRAADRALATSNGFMRGAGAERDEARDEERAAELAAGHGPLRVVAAVGVDAADVLELEAAAARLLSDAAACGVRLRRCDGDHRRGVLATVPGWCAP